MSNELKDRFNSFKESQLNLLKNILDQLNSLNIRLEVVETKLEENP